MVRPVRVRVPTARFSFVTPDPLTTESTTPSRQNNHNGHPTPSTAPLPTPSIPTPETLPNLPESESFPTRLLSTLNLNFNTPPWPFSKSKPVPSTKPPDLRKRDTLQSQNITIGVVVGVFLAIFLIALFYFLYRYNASIRLKKKRRKRRRASRTGSGSSKGSTSSTSTQGSGPPGEAAGV